MAIENKTSKKPKWLSKLEQQSWQAELLISGIAIYGSLQLLDVLNATIEHAVYNYSNSILNSLEFVIMYFFFMINALILNFIIHFIARAFWIGMIGLSSVYPDGVTAKEKSFQFSPHLFEQLRKEFSDVNQFNLKIDRFCSILFALSFLLALFFFVSMALLFFVFGVSKILTSFTSIDEETSMLIGFFLFTTPYILLSLFNLKILNDRAWVKKIHYPFYKFGNKLILTIFYEPFHYIYLIFYTNVKATRFYLTFTFYFILLGFISLPMVKSSYGMLADSKKFHSIAAYENQFHEASYENLRNPKKNRYVPTIQSDIIKDQFIKLYIPKHEREEEAFHAICGIWEKDEQLSKAENRRNRSLFYTACCPKYYTIYIDDKKIDQLKFNYYKEGLIHTTGFVSYIPIQNLSPGEHLLKLEQAYKNKDGENKISYISFWYEG